VFLSKEDVEAHYEGFSNSSIWPLLHYLPNYLRYEPSWWEHYQSVNHKFAEKVLENAHHDDLVWVHDYQLMLLPALLKVASPNLRIGFFLHTPFPAYEIFRCHPRRRELVAGMLGADLVGFHTFGYLRHFCDSVQRLLGIEAELTHIRSDRHCTTLGVYPIGINAVKFEKCSIRSNSIVGVSSFVSPTRANGWSYPWSGWITPRVSSIDWKPSTVSWPD
jgi:trehalose 6-phosphate synthase/phosphatase